MNANESLSAFFVVCMYDKKTKQLYVLLSRHLSPPVIFSSLEQKVQILKYNINNQV